MSGTTPLVGYPDQRPPGNRINSTVAFEDGSTIPAHDTVQFVVPAERAGNVGYLIANVDDHVLMIAQPKFPDGFIPDQSLQLMHPTTGSVQLDIPITHFGDGYNVTFANGDSVTRNCFLVVLQVIGAGADDLILPYLSFTADEANLGAGDDSANTRIPQAGIYDRATITALVSDAAEMHAHWTFVHDTGSGWDFADVDDILATSMGPATFEVDVPIRGPGLAISFHNAAAVDIDIIWAVRLYRLR